MILDASAFSYFRVHNEYNNVNPRRISDGFYKTHESVKYISLSRGIDTFYNNYSYVESFLNRRRDKVGDNPRTRTQTSFISSDRAQTTRPKLYYTFNSSNIFFSNPRQIRDKHNIVYIWHYHEYSSLDHW